MRFRNEPDRRAADDKAPRLLPRAQLLGFQREKRDLHSVVIVELDLECRRVGVLIDSRPHQASTQVLVWKVHGQFNHLELPHCFPFGGKLFVTSQELRELRGIGSIPDSRLRSAHDTRTQQRHRNLDELHAKAESLHNQLRDQWPDAAASLTTTRHESLLRWLVAAAQDLADGRSHDGIRAFVQHHNPANDKARDDLSTLLKDCGWEPDAVRQLGVDRNPYIGLGGPIQAHHGTQILDFTGWPGPHDIRLPTDSTMRLACVPGTETLAIIENRQAAETICDLHPDIAVIWCRGQHPDAVADLIAQAAHTVSQVLVCTDADLGGVRIAARIHDHLTPGITPTLIDVGTIDHPQRQPFNPTTLQHIQTYSQRTDAIGKLATAIAARGYPVIQEAPIRRALQDHLGVPAAAPRTVSQSDQRHEH